MKKKPTKELVLRIVSICVLTFILVAFLMTTWSVGVRSNLQDSHRAVNGYVAIGNSVAQEESVYLNGSWESFEGVVCTTGEAVDSLGTAQGFTDFPIGSIVQAKKDATYRLHFSLPKDGQRDIFLYIPTFYKSADVYLNGEKQDYLKNGATWLPFSDMQSILHLNNFDPTKEWQELVITGDFSSMATTLHKRPVVMGTLNNVSSLDMFTAANEMFLFGILLLILINGFVFMLFRPSHKIISYMTIFDSMILLRTAFSMNFVIAFIKNIFPTLPPCDFSASAFTLFCLMLGGIIGCKLSTAIYDPEEKAPKWLIRPFPWIYAVFAVIFPLMPTFFENYGKYILIPVYIFTFIGVFVQYKISLASPLHRVYNLMQMVKTIYIGALIFLDILFWNSGDDILLLFYLYGIFFILHVIVRLYDNNESYREVEVLNASLENTVLQRTHELSEANHILSELSTKDSLTQIYNRLYFEQLMERVLGSFQPGDTLQLCMFDLDFFKKINDTYGHSAGDEQLRFMAKMVAGVVGDKAMLARIGGEEFVLLFSGVDLNSALVCTEAVRAALSMDAEQNEKHTTASFGISIYMEGDTTKTLMKRADLALYEAKRLGRNQIVARVNNEFFSIVNGRDARDVQ